MDLHALETEFKQNIFRNEDDVKIHFHSDIIKPILCEVNPAMVGQYHSEDILMAGGRTDATFQNVSFEFKKLAYFNSQKGIDEALYGRDESDHGLYDYLISNADIRESDSEQVIVSKLLSGIGVGFDFETGRYNPFAFRYRQFCPDGNWKFDGTFEQEWSCE